jgi:hypothetical protein
MTRNNSWSVRLLLFSIGIPALILLTAPTRPPAHAMGHFPVHLSSDWSNHHLVFSAPATGAQAWRLEAEPRFMQQLFRRGARAYPAGAAKMSLWSAVARAQHSDWAVQLSPNASDGADMYPAKFSFDITGTPSCTNDYVVFNTRLAGSATTPSIIAFNQLYSGTAGGNGICGTGGPSVMWSYNTGAGTTLTSPVISFDGTKIAYVESNPAFRGGAILHILKWQRGQGAYIPPATPTPATPDNNISGLSWSACTTGSCIVNIPLSGGRPVTLSSPFYDYGTDVLYVGDNSGVLHKITGVFNGTPTEVITCAAAPCTNAWPLTVHGGSALTGPVYDGVSGNIFVGDGGGRLDYVQEVGSTVGSCRTAADVPPCLGASFRPMGGFIADAPIVDSTTGRVFAFNGTATAPIANATVMQTDTQLSNASVVAAAVGPNSGARLYDGGFDNAYFSSASPTITGFLYVCGKAIGPTNSPALYRIGFNGSGVMNAAPDPGFLTLVGANGAACSPVTEIYNSNTSTDWIFFSVTNRSNQTGCTGTGCVMSLNLTTLGLWPPLGTTNGAPASGGTSGIIIDNIGTGGQEANIYFTWLANATAGNPCNGSRAVGCAVKLTQAGLQ